MCILIKFMVLISTTKGSTTHLWMGVVTHVLDAFFFVFRARHLFSELHSCLKFTINIWSASGKNVFRNAHAFENFVLFCSLQSSYVPNGSIYRSTCKLNVFYFSSLNRNGFKHLRFSTISIRQWNFWVERSTVFLCEYFLCVP